MHQCGSACVELHLQSFPKATAPNMSRLLLLQFTYLVVCGEASPAAKRLYYSLDQHEPVNEADFPSKTLSYRRSQHRRSRQIIFPGNDPETFSRRSGTHIVFPGETPFFPATDLDNRASPADAANPGPADTPSTGLASKCEVGADFNYTYEGRTWRLLSRGPCAEGEWAVMVAECQPGCRPLPCPPGQLRHQGRCVDMTDSTVCGEGQVLYLDQTGSTFCDCANDYLSYQGHNTCYPRQEQGPCDFGFYLDLNEDDSVECMPNDCWVDGYTKDPATGKCFSKDYVGYCPKDWLQFHINKKTVDCFHFGIRGIFDPVTEGCLKNSGLARNGKQGDKTLCVPTFIFTPYSRSYGCPMGYTKVGRGPCRKINNI